MEFDEVLTTIGELGLFQRRLFLLMCLPAGFPSAVVFLSHIFVAAVPDHHCRPPDLEDGGELLWRSLARPEEEYTSVLTSLVVPRHHHGGGQFEKCRQFDTDLGEVIKELTRTVGTAAGPGYDGVSQLNATSVADFVATQNWPLVNCRHGWTYDTTGYPETLATKMDVVCDRQWQVSCAQSVFFVGGVLGNVLFGWLADKLGRRPSFLLTNALMLASGVASICPPTYAVYIVLRFLIGLTFPTVYQLAFLIVVETIGPSYRTMAAMMLAISFSLGMMAFAIVASFLPHWRTLLIVSWMPYILSLGYYWLVPESPRWLLSQGRLAEAEELVQKMAKVNGVDLPKDFLSSKLMASAVGSKPDSKKNHSAELPPHEVANGSATFHLREFLKYPKVIRRMIVLGFIWTINAMVYAGMSFGVPELASSPYVALFLSGLVEVPGIFLGWAGMNYIGRRTTMIITMLASGLLSAVTAAVPADIAWLRMMVPSLAKMFICTAFTVIYVFGGELFPTVVRGFALGFSSTASGIGLVVTPYILFMGALYGQTVPFLVFGLLSAIGGILLVTLPETLNARLPATLVEAEHFHKYCSGAAKKAGKVPTTPGDDNPVAVISAQTVTATVQQCERSHHQKSSPTG